MNRVHGPCSIKTNTKEVIMSPSIMEMAKTDITGLWIEATFSTGLSLPKVCKTSIPGMKIKPTLDDQKKQRAMYENQSLNCKIFHTNNKGHSDSLERRELDTDQKNALHPCYLIRKMYHIKFTASKCRR